MQYRPIIFSDPMVRAILAGRKTQTRRIVNPQPPEYIDELHDGELRKRAPYRLECNETGSILGQGFEDDDDHLYQCRQGVPGDRLWVRESFCRKADDEGMPVWNASGNLDATCYYFRADGVEVRKVDGDGFTEFRKNGTEASPWSSPIYMPRHASRITLEVVSVRVERVQDISEEDLRAELDWSRIAIPDDSDPWGVFADLWSDINGPESWDANPWVWVIEFRRVEYVT
jgi:hypothetical protein